MGQIDISAAAVTAANQTYTGSALTPNPTVVLDGETIPSTGYDVAYSNNTNAGTATITITGKGDYTGTAIGTFTIAKANPVYVAPTAQSLTYSRSAQWLTTTGSTSHGDIVFSSDGNVWTSQRISGTNAGSYTTYWKLIGDSNHNSVSSTSITTVINKATPVVATPPSLVSGLIYSGSAQNLLSGGSFKHSSTDATAVAGTFTYQQGTNAGTYENPTFTFTPTDTTNYNNVSAYRVGSVTIGKANASVTKAPTAKTGQTYNGNAKVLVNAGTASGGTMYYYATTTNSKPSSTTSFTTTIPTKTNAGTYYVWYYVKGDSNHNDTAISSTAVSVTIAKANRTISFTTAPTWVGTGKTVTVVASPSAGSGDGAITYTSGSTSKATISGSTVTGVSEGSVTITATIASGTNYNSATTSYSMTVVNSANYVDLGLPSGTMWANFNIDVEEANKFVSDGSKVGSFFSWGNTDGHNIANLIDESTLTADKVINYNGVIQDSVGGGYVTDYIPVNGHDIICNSNVTSTSYAIAYNVYDQNKQYLRHADRGSVQYTYQDGDYYVIMWFGWMVHTSIGAHANYGTVLNDFDIEFTQATYNNTPGASLTGNIPLTHDAARVHLGQPWAMPTQTQYNELVNASNTTMTESTVNGVHGKLFTSVRNGNTLFIPYCGYLNNALILSYKEGAYRSKLWSAGYSSSTAAVSIFIRSDGDTYIVSSSRYLGMPIRPIIK